MEGNVREGRPIGVSIKELNRQFRLSKQTMAMHYSLHDLNKVKSLIAEGVLVVTAVLFCATTFASDDVYHLFGLKPLASRVILGVASVLAFAASMLLMLVDWRGTAARHKESAERWAVAVRYFRENQTDDETWPKEKANELSRTYWDAARNEFPIPDKQFNILKAKYRHKIEISKMVDRYPGAPWVTLWALTRLKGLWRSVRGELTHHDKLQQRKN